MKIKVYRLILLSLVLTISCSKKPSADPSLTPQGTGSSSTMNDVVYIRSDIGKFEALDASTGNVKWSLILDSNANINHTAIYSTPAYADSTLYIGSSNYYIYAINAKTGTVKWRYLTDRVFASPTGRYYSSPAISNKVLYIGGAKLYAINTTDGSLKWSKALDGREIDSSPLVVNNTVYVNSNEDFYSFDANTGIQLAKVNKFTYDFRNASPCYYNGKIYNIAEKINIPIYVGVVLYTADPQTLNIAGIGGSVDYLLNGDNTQSFFSSPTVNNQSVYVCSDSLLYSFDIITPYINPLRWKFKSNGNFHYTSPISDSTKVYAGNNKGLLYAININTGIPIWVFDVKLKGGDEIINSPVLANNVIYISSNKAIYAINAFDGSEIWHKNTFGNYHAGSSGVVISKTGQVFNSSISPMQN